MPPNQSQWRGYCAGIGSLTFNQKPRGFDSRPRHVTSRMKDGYLTIRGGNANIGETREAPPVIRQHARYCLWSPLLTQGRSKVRAPMVCQGRK